MLAFLADSEVRVPARGVCGGAFVLPTALSVHCLSLLEALKR